MQDGLGGLPPARRAGVVLVLACALVLMVGAAGWAFTNGVFQTTAVTSPQASPPVEKAGFIQNSGGTKGWANIRADLRCTVSATVNIRFHLVQKRVVADDASLNYPCTPGAQARIFSDFLGAFSPGSAKVVVTTTALGQSKTTSGTVSLASWSLTISHLRTALSGSKGNAVAAQLKADLAWRSQYNPKFHTVWIAALGGQ